MTTKRKPAASRKAVASDPHCNDCRGRGWVREPNGWPIECRCVFRMATTKPKAPA